MDHKTGQELEPKVLKEEMPHTPVPSSTPGIPAQPDTDPLLDFPLNKSDELLLHQSLLNMPIASDDKFLLPQHIDLISGKCFLKVFYDVTLTLNYRNFICVIILIQCTL